MKRNRLTAVLSLILCLSLCGCSPESGNGTNFLTGETRKWVDSDIQGFVLADMEYRLQDDFAAAVNKEWKLEDPDRFSETFQEVSDAVHAKMKAAVTDPSIEGEEAEVLRKYYALSSDWDYRNTAGVEPLRPYIEDIESIGSMEELYAFCGDLKRNPLTLAPVGVAVTSGIHTAKYPDMNITVVDAPTLSLTNGNGQDLYTEMNTPSGLMVYEEKLNKIVYLLGRLGYSEKEAAEIFRNCLIWEKDVSESKEAMGAADLDDHIADYYTAVSCAGSFPLDELLKAWGYHDTGYLIVNPKFAKKLPSLCKKRNMEKIKDYMIVNYCLACGDYLDRETFDRFREFEEPRVGVIIDTGETEEQKEDNLQFDKYIAQTPILGAMNKVYADHYFDEEITNELTAITQEEIEAFKEIFSSEPWLSEEGKAACVEKLSHMKIHIAHQSCEVLDYSRTPFLSKEEGGSFLEAYCAMERYRNYHYTMLAERKFDREYWDPLEPQFSTTQTNAFYNPATNGIYICAGICEPYEYAPDMAYEEKLAGLFTVVGHEITHGFDKDGAQYDKDGMQETWLPYQDLMAFNDRSDKVGSYYSVMTPFPGSGLYQGDKLAGEATADMGGLRVTLYLASRHPGFDYDLYFRSYARCYRKNIPLEVEKMYFSNDVHPLNFYRVNVGVQQFDEFTETYGVKEGDGMYLAPENRIKVW